jgi:glutamate racemase
MSDLRPIGVFDSGVGGLTVVAALSQVLPGESILYLGDTARLPYGTKSAETVIRYTERNLDFLVARDVKAVVVACNTASAAALPGITEPVPLWGVIEPGAARAAELSSGRVGVIGTEATVRSGAYTDALHALRPEIEVVSAACPLFVPLVEEGWFDDPLSEAIARRYLEPLLAEGIDSLVLGCTHYPLLAPLIARVVGADVKLVDSAETVAARVAFELERRDALAAGSRGEDHLFVTDDTERFERLARSILGREARLELIDIGNGGRER